MGSVEFHFIPQVTTGREEFTEPSFDPSSVLLGTLSLFFKQGSAPAETVTIQKKLARAIGDGSDFKEAFFQLSHFEQAKIKKQIGAKTLAKILYLSQERDPVLFWNKLLGFSQRLVGKGRLPVAAGILHLISQEKPSTPIPPSFQKMAQKELKAMEGHGPFGARMEFLSAGFTDELFHPASLAAMLAGGMVYRLARLGMFSRLVNFSKAGFWTRGWRAKSVASGVGFLAEVPTFTLTAKGVQQAMGGHVDWGFSAFIKDSAQGAFLLGGLRLTGWGAQGALEAWSANRLPFEKIAKFALPQGAMFSSILGSQQIGQWSGLIPNRDGVTMVTDSLATLFHFNLAGGMIRRGTGRTFQQWEKMLDAKMQALAVQQAPQGPSFLPGFKNFLKGLNPLGNLLPHSLGSKRVPSIEAKFPGPEKSQPLKMSTLGDGSTPADNKGLRDRYRPQFSTKDYPTFPEQILDSALATPSQLHQFHERLLEAYARYPLAGSRDQLFMVRAIQDVFLNDAMNSSTGSLQHALIQSFITRAMMDTFPPRRNGAMQWLFHVMKEGPSPELLTHLFEKFNYHLGDRVQSQETYPHQFKLRHEGNAHWDWEGYAKEDIAPLLNMVHELAPTDAVRAEHLIRVIGEARHSGQYQLKDIDAVLTLARKHPLGRILLRRLFHVLVSQDIPAKIKEIMPQKQKSMDKKSVAKFSDSKLSPEKIARKINGTRHTAHIDDIRLARKTVSVMGEINNFMSNPHLRKINKRAFDDAFWEFMESGRSLKASDVLALLETDPQPRVLLLKEAIKNGEIQIKVVSKEKFQEELADMKGISDAQALFLFKKDPKQPDEILIKDISLPKSKDPEIQKQSYSFFIDLTEGLHHELEHWVHTRNHYEGMERDSGVFNLFELERKDLLVSEIMADLEGIRWRVRNVDQEPLEVAKKLGQTIVEYLRDIQDEAHFGKENQRITKEKIWD